MKYLLIYNNQPKKIIFRKNLPNVSYLCVNIAPLRPKAERSHQHKVNMNVLVIIVLGI